MTTFYMVRHGEPDWYSNEKYGFKGHGRDLVDLTPKGVEQAKYTAQLLKGKHAEIMIVSPYTRTMHTAAIINRTLNLEMMIEVDLREWQPDLTYEYQTFEEFMQLCEEYDRCEGIPPIDKEIKWESRVALKNRVDKVLEKYLNYQRVIIVAHERVIKSQAGDELVDHCEVIEITR